MSLLMDALKKAEEDKLQQADENQMPEDAEITPSEPASEIAAIGSETELTLVEQTLSLEPPDLDPHSEQQVESQVLPNMSFLTGSRPHDQSISNQPKNSSVTENISISTNKETSNSTPTPQADSNQSTSNVRMPDTSQNPPSTQTEQSVAIPYQPKTQQNKALRIGSFIIGLMVFGAGGTYYFINALDNIGQGSNLNQKANLSQDSEPAPDSPLNPVPPQTEVETAIAEKIDPADKLTVIADEKIQPNEKIIPVALPVTTPVIVAKLNTVKKPAAVQQSPQPAGKIKNTTEISTESEKTPLTIVHQKQIDPVQTLLNEAFNAYSKGNYVSANELYQQVLGLKENHRDALLGLAVIAHRNQQPTQALFYYRKILSLNPKDSEAASGLIALELSSNATESESRLKLLLEHEPQAAYLHFTLGNQYVSQARWADAQQAFFQAYHADPGNADYAMNLAVSLDQIKQPQAALQYYRLALKLAKGKNVSFSVLDVARRINTLSQDSTP